MKVQFEVLVTRKGHVVTVERHSDREKAERLVERLEAKHRLKGTLRPVYSR